VERKNNFPAGYVQLLGETNSKGKGGGNGVSENETKFQDEFVSFPSALKYKDQFSSSGIFQSYICHLKKEKHFNLIVVNLEKTFGNSKF